VTVTTDLDRFRLELGDHPTPDVPEGTYVYLFNDDEAVYFIAKHPSNLLLAVADACDALAARFAREFDFDSTKEKSFKRSQKADHYLAMAVRLRTRALTEGDDTGTGGLPLGSFPAPHDWQRDLAGIATNINPATGWPL
jgi:hypothetical protein